MINNFSKLHNARPKSAWSNASLSTPKLQIINKSFVYKPNTIKSGRPTYRMLSTSTTAPPTLDETKVYKPAPFPLGPGPDVTDKVTKLAHQVQNLTMAETFEFMKALARVLKLDEDYFINSSAPAPAYYPPPGSYAPPPGGVAPPPQGQAGAATPAPAKKEEKKEEKKEKSTVTIKLVKVAEGDKYKVLKEVRTIKPGMNLTESKVMVDTLPSTLKEAVPIEEAKKIAEKIKAAGGEVILE